MARLRLDNFLGIGYINPNGKAGRSGSEDGRRGARFTNTALEAVSGLLYGYI